MFMGSPTSPLFADIVMEDCGTECLRILKNEYNTIPLFYFRYVDDTLMCVKRQSIDTILSVFNNYDDNLNFTFELGIENKLNFLDVLLIRENGKIVTNWYQKPTNTDRIHNFNSSHKIQLKRNIIFNLVDRAVLLSDKKFHNYNINFIK